MQLIAGVKLMGNRAVLCPGCRQIIGSEESRCSWCGRSRSNYWWWNLTGLSRASSGTGWFLIAVILLNIIYFAISLLLSTKVDRLSGFFTPGQNSLFMLGASGTIPVDKYGRFWSLLTANYLHAGVFHLLFNLMALRQLVPWVITEYGNSRTAFIYTFGGITGYFISYLAKVPFTVGASSAICSLIGALLYFGKSRGGVYGSSVYKEVSSWVVSLFIFGFIFPGINNWAHGGGILGGVILGWLMGYNVRRKEWVLHYILAIFSVILTICSLLWGLFGARI